MSQKPPKVLYEHSFWSRLLDPRSLAEERAEANSRSELARLRSEVQENLRWILQSRRTPGEIPGELSEIRKSLVTYGLQDLNNLSPANTGDLELLRGLLVETIKAFEPRLQDVKAVYTEQKESSSGLEINYRVEAFLKVDPAPIRFVFEPVFDLATKTFEVKDGS